MKKVLLLTLALLLICSSSGDSRAQVAGVSYFAMSGFNARQCEAALEVFRDVAVPAVATLWGTFGSDTRCLRRFLTMFAGRRHIVEVHIANQTCVKYEDCERGEVGFGYSSRNFNADLEKKDARLISALRRRIAEIVSFMAEHRNANTELLLSAGLEDRYSAYGFQVVRQLLEDARAVTPFAIVRNVERLKAVSDVDYLELHGFRRQFAPEWHGRCIFNNDGSNILFRTRTVLSFARIQSAILEPLADGCIVFLWWGRPQGLGGVADRERSNVPPGKRQLVVRPREVAGINGLLKTTSNVWPQNGTP